MDTLQTLHTELEEARTASVRGWKAKALRGQTCLTAGESADEQAGEMTELLLRSGSCSDGEEGEEKLAERATRVGFEPVSRTRFSGQDVADVASQAMSELEAKRLGALRQMRGGQHLVALHARQALQLIISD